MRFWFWLTVLLLVLLGTIMSFNDFTRLNLKKIKYMTWLFIFNIR